MPEPVKPKVLTQVASHAHTIADTFRAAFAKTKLGEHGVEMTAPEGSTKGGLLALQHITLRSPTGLSLVVGTVNAIETRAELRSFAYVGKTHEERFKRPIDFDAAAYDAFLEKARSVLAAFGLEITVLDAPASPAAAEAAEEEPLSEPPGARPPYVLIGAAVVFALLAALALWAAVR
jgi:hypothetical protein